MTRLGFYTGKLYGPDVDASTINECCRVLDFKEPVSPDDELVVRKRIELRQRCEGCSGCPASLGI